ncbi:MAG: hypothetical protein MUO62_04040 [Anaerolineales bacterium]|nr:hypothetical protein [Anaerolineales bacterium]
MKNDIIFFVEHVARELDIACAIKAILSKDRGISVNIKSIAHDLDKTVTLPEPKLVILPHCNGVINRPPEKMIPKWPNAKYLSLAYEQVLGKAQLEYLSEKDEFTSQYVFHSVWGDFYREILIKTGVQADHIRVNGSSTLNLYRRPYRKFYPQDKSLLAEKHGLSLQKRWVFIPGNYGWAFFHDKLVRDRIKRGFDPDQAYQYREFSRRSLELTAKWWTKLSKETDVELIVRPRPATPEQDFRDKLSEYGVPIPPHMHIIKDGTVREWIMVSDIVMSSFSTALIEAAVAHKPIYMLTPVPLPDFIFTDWYDYAPKIQTQESFTQICTKPDIEPNWKDLENWVYRKLSSDGDAILNIVETINEILDGHVDLQSPKIIARRINSPHPSNLYRKSRKLAWRVYQNLVNAFGYTTPEQKREAHEKDHIPPEIVDLKVAEWEKVLGL